MYSYTSTQGGHWLVMLALFGAAPGLVGVRDTKDRQDGTLAVNRTAWSQFIAAIKSDRY